MPDALTVGSLFTGVGGFDLGLERAGHRVVFQCEIDPFCRGILAERWPGVPCYEDVREVASLCGRERPGEVDGDLGGADAERSRVQLGGPLPDVDLLCGGFPCQDLSVAGHRRGLAGERSGLFFEFARCADELVRPGGWVLVENVPGLLSSASGRDFAVVVRTLGDIGFHDLAWRVLDSRYFGVPQRRRRVYILGRRAAGQRAREVLLEPEGGGGNHSPGSEARPRVANCLSKGSCRAGSSAPGRRQEDDWNIVSPLLARRGRTGDTSAEAAAGGHLIAGTVRSHMRPGSSDHGGVVAPALVKRYAKGTDSDASDCLVAHTLTHDGFDASEDGTGRGTRLVSAASDPDGVRAATGLPGRVDDPRPDGPRYAAMGNAITVNVAEWIGRRLAA